MKIRLDIGFSYENLNIRKYTSMDRRLLYSSGHIDFTGNHTLTKLLILL